MKIHLGLVCLFLSYSFLQTPVAMGGTDSNSQIEDGSNSSSIKRLNTIMGHINPSQSKPKIEKQKRGTTLIKSQTFPEVQKGEIGRINHPFVVHPLRGKYTNQIKRNRTLFEAKSESKQPFTETTAKVFSNMRNKTKSEILSETPPEFLKKIKKRNKKVYGTAKGPTFDYLKNKKSKSPKEISESATRTDGSDLDFKPKITSRRYTFPLTKREKPQIRQDHVDALQEKMKLGDLDMKE